MLTDDDYDKEVQAKAVKALSDLADAVANGKAVDVMTLDRLSFGVGFLLGKNEALRMQIRSLEAELARPRRNHQKPVQKSSQKPPRESLS